MDVDISDILADVSHLPALPGSSSSSSVQPYKYTLLSDPQTTLQDHQLLVRAWTSERCAPDLLPYPTELMQRVMQRVREQIERIEDLTSDPAAYMGGGGRGERGGGGSSQNLNLVLSILQTDLSRTQFLIRSLLRQRLAKITKHAVFYLTGLQADTKKRLLSEEEIKFVQHHQSLLGGLYGSAFLDAMPASLRRLDDTAGGDRMVEGPDGMGAVVVRCLAERWDNEGEGRGEGEEGRVGLRMGSGEVWVVRWRDVKEGVVGGQLELL